MSAMEFCTESTVAWKDKLRSFILENYLFTDDQGMLADKDSFLDKGILDSTGILELIFFLEEEFGVQVEEGEMIPENLDSVENLLNFLDRKTVVP